jgi:hypothetical protein
MAYKVSSKDDNAVAISMERHRVYGGYSLVVVYHLALEELETLRYRTVIRISFGDVP